MKYEDYKNIAEKVVNYISNKYLKKLPMCISFHEDKNNYSSYNIKYDCVNRFGRISVEKNWMKFYKDNINAPRFKAYKQLCKFVKPKDRGITFTLMAICHEMGHQIDYNNNIISNIYANIGYGYTMVNQFKDGNYQWIPNECFADNFAYSIIFDILDLVGIEYSLPKLEYKYIKQYMRKKYYKKPNGILYTEYDEKYLDKRCRKNNSKYIYNNYKEIFRIMYILLTAMPVNIYVEDVDYIYAICNRIKLNKLIKRSKGLNLYSDIYRMSYMFIELDKVIKGIQKLEKQDTIKEIH